MDAYKVFKKINQSRDTIFDGSNNDNIVMQLVGHIYIPIGGAHIYDRVPIGLYTPIVYFRCTYVGSWVKMSTFL